MTAPDNSVEAASKAESVRDRWKGEVRWEVTWEVTWSGRWKEKPLQKERRLGVVAEEAGKSKRKRRKRRKKSFVAESCWFQDTLSLSECWAESDASVVAVFCFFCIG